MEPELRPHCPDCEVSIGHYHKAGCDSEDCPYCGLQLLSCEHGEEGSGPPLDDVMPWSGMREMEKAAYELEWYAVLIPGQGWVPCPKDMKGCHPDLNRVCMECVWDRFNKKFIPRGQNHA